MAWTPEQLAALERIMAQGTSSAAYQDRRVNYRTLDELRSLREEMRRSLGGDAGRENLVRTTFEKGL